MTYEDVCQKGLEREVKIRKAMPDINIKTVWQCEIEQERKQNEKLQGYFQDYKSNLEINEPLNARAGLYGMFQNGVCLS